MASIAAGDTFDSHEAVKGGMDDDKAEKEVWFSHVDPESGDTYYSNNDGVVVWDIPDHLISVVIPYDEDAHEPHVSSHENSDIDRQISGSLSQPSNTSDSSKASLPTSLNLNLSLPSSLQVYNEKDSESVSQTRTSRRAARVRRLSMSGKKLSAAQMDDRPESKGAANSTPRAKALKSLTRKRRGRRNSTMSRVESLIDSDGAANINAQVNRRRQKNRRMSTSITASQLHKANVKSKESCAIKVFLLDGTNARFNATPKTKVRHALMILGNEFKLTNDGDFGLFLLDGGFANGTYTLIDDEESYLLDNLGEDWSDHHQKPSLLDNPKSTEFARHLIMRRRIYLPWSPLYKEREDAKTTLNGAHRLELCECLHNCKTGIYPLNKGMIYEIVSLRVQAHLGDWKKDKELRSQASELCSNFFPEYFIQNRSLKKYTKRVEDYWKDLRGTSSLRAEQLIIENCQFWFPWYGCFFFRVDLQTNAAVEEGGSLMSDLVLGVGHRGLYFLAKTSGATMKIQPMELVSASKYGELQDWEVSDSGMSVSYLLKSRNGMANYIISRDAQAIANLASEYMFEYNEIMKAVGDKLETLTFDEIREEVDISRSRANGNELAMQKRAEAAKGFIKQ